LFPLVKRSTEEREAAKQCGWPKSQIVLQSGAVQFDFLVVFTPEIDLLLSPWARERKRINPISGSRPTLFRSQEVVCFLCCLFILLQIQFIS
jgi:hypothetical protein